MSILIQANEQQEKREIEETKERRTKERRARYEVFLIQRKERIRKGNWEQKKSLKWKDEKSIKSINKKTKRS